VVGNKFADAIAKHAALHNNKHDVAFFPPSPDGNPFTRIYWLAEEENETHQSTTKTSLAPLQYMKDKVKAYMGKHHRLMMLIQAQVTTTIGRDCSPPESYS